MLHWLRARFALFFALLNLPFTVLSGCAASSTATPAPQKGGVTRVVVSLPGPYRYEPRSWRDGLSFEMLRQGTKSMEPVSIVSTTVSEFLVEGSTHNGNMLITRAVSGTDELVRTLASPHECEAAYSFSRIALEPSPGRGLVTLKLSGPGAHGPWHLAMAPRGTIGEAVEASGIEAHAEIELEAGVYVASLRTESVNGERRALCLVLSSRVTELSFEIAPSPSPRPVPPSAPKAARGIAEARASPSPGPGAYGVIASIDLPPSSKPAPPSAIAAIGPFLALASKAEAGLRICKLEAMDGMVSITDLGRVVAPGKVARYDALATRGDSLYASSRESRRVDRFVQKGEGFTHSWSFEDKEALRGIVGICAGGDSLFAAIDDTGGDDALLELTLGSEGQIKVASIARFGPKDALRNPRALAASADGNWVAIALGGSEGLAIYRKSGASWERIALYQVTVPGGGPSSPSVSAGGEVIRMRSLAGIKGLGVMGGGSALCTASAGGALGFFALSPSGAAEAGGLEPIGSARPTAFAVEGSLMAAALSGKEGASIRLASSERKPDPGIDALLGPAVLGSEGAITGLAFAEGGLAACFESKGGTMRIALIGKIAPR